MTRLFGFDIGTTSIGFAVIDHDHDRQTGDILRLGVRIFPEARDPDGTPLNQQRRLKRMMRRQLRRRRERRRLLGEILNDAGLLPAFGSKEWPGIMRLDPYELRARGVSEGEALTPHELGRAFYHLAKRRHFRGRDLEETEETDGPETDTEQSAEEKQAQSNREETRQALKKSGLPLGAWLSGFGSHERKRGRHAHRDDVHGEFEKLWNAQAKHHPALDNATLRERVEQTIFAQRPVFWRKNTLGDCRFVPSAPLCPKGSWLSQQRRMLEKLNNLALTSGNLRRLDREERAAILEKLQVQASMSWGGVRSALKPLYKARGQAGAEKALHFNLEIGGEPKLLGNALEAKLAGIFGVDWKNHPHKQAIREALHQRLWEADYGEIGTQRVVIRATHERRRHRQEAAESFTRDFGVTPEQATAIRDLKLPTGWEPYSIEALRAFLPRLEEGIRFGALINGPEWEDWRQETFPGREQPTGEFVNRLPSPAQHEESRRLAQVRNPTVIRVQNELRKVVNNLIDLYGKPELIRIEMTREVGRSKRDREEALRANRRQERRRKDAIKDLEAKGITEPSRDTVEKWLLWKECRERCPYTGQQIGFDALFREGRFDIEHIWPRSKSFDNSYKNKTLCHRDKNIEKGNRTPFEAFGTTPEWERMTERVWECVKAKTMTRGKAKRFCDPRPLPDDFTARQLTDTGYAARQAVAFLSRLWPDIGPEAPVKVLPVTGRVTAQLRRLWGLNNVLADDGEKTRADHRHHAIDALVVACAHPGMTNRLSRYWQALEQGAQKPALPAPWPAIRADAERAVADIVVSHRVRKKVSGPLHKETVYGDTHGDVATKTGVYRQFVTRKKVEALTKDEIWPKDERDGIRDLRVRKAIQDWVAAHGGDPKKAFPPYPRLGKNGPEIRKVRVLTKQQLGLMAKVGTGYADLGSNHHIAIYRLPNGKADCEVVSLYEAARRLSRREPIVRRERGDGAEFVMSLSPGDALEFPDGDKKGIWIVQGAWANEQVVLETATDANHATTTRPKPSAILKDGGRKVSINPIGRIRPAGD